MKTLDDYFSDWESYVFGFGYGTGEIPVLKCLKQFICAIPETGTYDYTKLEDAVGEAQAWLLINILAHADIIEYGSSPRFGWLTIEGLELRKYIESQDIERLINICTENTEDYSYCYPDHCDCDEEQCNNPFWISKHD